MANAKLSRIPSAKKPDENYIKDPAIVKVAKLALILADKETDVETKRLCVMAAMRMEYITKEEARQLLLYRVDLERFGDDEDENLHS